MLLLSIKLAVRNIVRQPFYTFINITGLVLGLLSFYLILLHVKHELSFDTFHKKINNIYRLTSATKERVAAIVPYSWGQPMLEEITAIENKVSFQNITIALTVRKGDRVFSQQGFIGVDSTFLDIFDFPILKGNSKELLRNPDKMLITPEIAAKYFEGKDPIGETLEVNLWGNFVNYEIEGIVDCPANSHIQFKFLIPMHRVREHFFSPTAFDSWSIHFLYTYFQMAEEFDKNELESEMESFLERHGGKELKDKFTPGIEPLRDIYLKSDIRFDFQPRGDYQNLLILLAVAFGILSMAIINFININSAQAIRRVKEASLRKIMGSKKGSIMVDSLLETTMVALIASLLAILILVLVVPYFNEFTGNTFTTEDVFTWPNILTMLGILVAVSLSSGLYPALIIASFKTSRVVSSRSGDQLKKGNTRKILVIIQFTLSVLLLISSGIIYDQVKYMRQKELGYNKDQVLIMSNSRNVASDPVKMQLFRESITKYDGIQSVSASSSFPGDDQLWSSRYIPEGFSEKESVSLWTIYADYDFIKTYNIPIIIGRDFDYEIRSDSLGVLINEAAMRQFSLADPSWLTSPVGKYMDIRGGVKGLVIGVMRDFHFETFKQQLNPLVVQISPSSFFSIQIKLGGPHIQENVQVIKTTWENLFPQEPFVYTFLDERFEEQFYADQKLGNLMRIFTLLSIVIASIGLLGLATFMSHQKAREMSIRKVLGASVKQLTGQLGWEFIKLVLIANLVAIPLGIMLMNRWLETFAFKTSLSVSTVGMAAGISLLVTVITIARQALKTATENPVNVLSQE